MISSFNLGHFLSRKHIDSGFELLKKQITEKGFNFRCLDLQIYRREKSINAFNMNRFYNQYVAQDILYNYPSIFYSLKYGFPKSPYGVRKFNFLSFHLQVLYYSIGFYVLDLISQFLENLYQHNTKLKNQNTYYGGKLNLSEPNKSKIYYHSDYDEFGLKVKNFVRSRIGKSKSLAIKLDIHDFYPSINHKHLLMTLKSFVLPSDVKRLNYDEDAIQSISDLLFYIMAEKKGLPLSNQNIVSNFLSHVYLFKLDDFIAQLQLTFPQKISYYRYVNDFYLMIEYPNMTPNHEIGEDAFQISNQVADFLSSTLNLKLNSLKCSRTIIEDEGSFDKFIDKSKFISFFSPLIKVQPRERLEQVIDVLEGMKNEQKKIGEVKLSDEDDRLLKEVFRQALKQYLSSNDAKKMLDTVFADWRPWLTVYNVKALMLLLGKTTNALNKIEKFILINLSDKATNTQFCYLIEHFLLHEKYSQKLVRKIKKVEPLTTYFALLQRMLLKRRDKVRPKINLNQEMLKKEASLMQQVKKVVLAETNNDFNLAFNHLLNCLHVYCMVNDLKNSVSREKYSRNNVINFIRNKLTPADLHFVTAFFDRRNKNTISHPGDPKMENWVVSESEYSTYKSKLNNLLKKIK